MFSSAILMLCAILGKVSFNAVFIWSAKNFLAVSIDEHSEVLICWPSRKCFSYCSSTENNAIHPACGQNIDLYNCQSICFDNSLGSLDVVTFLVYDTFMIV